MQDLLMRLLWHNEEIYEAAGRDLYDQYFTQLMRYSSYEVRAYYSLGLGLRKELTQALKV